MAEIYVYAAVFGFMNKRRTPLKKDTPQISAKALSDEQNSVLLTLAVQDAKNINIMFEPEEVKKTINEFANGGIDLLEDLVGDRSGADAIIRMASDMRKCITEWDRK